MASSTTNLNLIIPEDDDLITPSVFATNFQIIDDLFAGGTGGVIINIKYEDYLVGAHFRAYCVKDGVTVEEADAVAISGTTTAVVRGKCIGTWTVVEDRYHTSVSIEVPYYGMYSVDVGGARANLIINYTSDMIGATVTASAYVPDGAVDDDGNPCDLVMEEHILEITSGTSVTIPYKNSTASTGVGNWKIVASMSGVGTSTKLFTIATLVDTTVSITSGWVILNLSTTDDSIKNTVVQVHDENDNHDTVQLLNGAAKYKTNFQNRAFPNVLEIGSPSTVEDSKRIQTTWVTYSSYGQTKNIELHREASEYCLYDNRYYPALPDPAETWKNGGYQSDIYEGADSQYISWNKVLELMLTSDAEKKQGISTKIKADISKYTYVCLDPAEGCDYGDDYEIYCRITNNDKTASKELTPHSGTHQVTSSEYATKVFKISDADKLLGQCYITLYGTNAAEGTASFQFDKVYLTNTLPGIWI